MSRLAQVGLIGMGAGLMFMLDPQAGGRRRALLRDKLRRLSRQGSRQASAIAEQISDHARGAVAETRARFSDEPVDDRTLVARVRAELGRMVTNVGAISVEARDGRVILSGPILSSQAGAAVAAARTTRGVRDVADRLERHEQPGNVPSLQRD